MRLGWFLLLVANAACLRTTAFHCTSSAQCESPGENGTCERVGYCSFPDPACPDGQRFGDLAGDSLSNTCVGAQVPIDAAPPMQVTIGGMVAGLTGTGLVLRDNTTDMLTVAMNGPFTFATKLLTGTAYQVTIGTPPSGQDAYVANGSGNANGPITDILVSCYAAGSDPGVLCDTGLFCSPGTEVCCMSPQSGSCKPTGGSCGASATMQCDSANDCSSNQVCCAHFHNGNNQLQDATCVANPGACQGGGPGTAEILCDPRDATPCQNGGQCTGTSMLGAAYHTCK